jgi:hypothetical protein
MQPKRQDEIQLYASMRANRNGHMQLVYGSAIRELSAELGINEKRVFRLIEKWEARGWFEMCSIPPGGWFTEEAPDRLEARMP